MLLLESQLMGRCMSRRPKWPSGDVNIDTFGVFPAVGMKTRAKVAAEQMSLRATTILRSLNSLKRIQGSEEQGGSRKARRHDEGHHRVQPYGPKKASQKPGAVVRVGPVLKLEKELRGRTIVVQLRLDGGHLQSNPSCSRLGGRALSCKPDEDRAGRDSASAGVAPETNAGDPLSTPGAASPCAMEIDQLPGPSNQEEAGVGQRRQMGEGQQDARHENWAQTSHMEAANQFASSQRGMQPPDLARGAAACAERGEHSGVGAAGAQAGEPVSSGQSKLRSCRSGGQNHNSGSENEQQAESSGRARVRRRLFDPPTSEELESFFAAAESSVQKSFEEKYNFDLESEAPLPGRFEWTRLQ